MDFPSVTIKEAMNRIVKNEYLIPAFQREYVWKPEQVEELFVSIMKGFPISSMLFWRIEKENRNICKFYHFLNNHKEEEVNNNMQEMNTINENFFTSVIDGQQRLTSMYLALNGTYEKKIKNKKKESEKFKKCQFYFNIGESDSESEYEFKWIRDDETDGNIKGDIYEKDGKRWFLCKQYQNYIISGDKFNKDFAKQNMSEDERDKLREFILKLCEKGIINYYEETDQNANRAVEIFTKINSGGTALEYADILFSFVTANWGKDDFRSDAEELIKNINSNYNFKISRDFILKSFLFLFHNEIKYNLKAFDLEFVEKTLKPNWNKIKECYDSVFKMLSNLNFSSDTVGALSAIHPILYFIYHKQIDINSKAQEENRKEIRSWLIRAIVWNAFSSSSDTVLTKMRKAFTEPDSIKKQKYFDDEKINLFPKLKIEKLADYMDDDYEKKLSYQKNDHKSTLLLYLLYPNLTLNNKKFDKDHMHPESQCEKVMKDDKKRWNSIVNLQLLEKRENESKNKTPFDKWIENNKWTKEEKETFFKDNYIPNDLTSLNISNFDEFYEKRKTLLLEKLKELVK